MTTPAESTLTAKKLCLNWSKPQKHFNILIFVLSVADASINKLYEFRIAEK